jgi:hypothetical protein
VIKALKNQAIIINWGMKLRSLSSNVFKKQTKHKQKAPF